jgi:hypothetical protein
MYVVMRQFRIRDGTDVNEVMRKIKARIVPALKAIDGFQSYRLLDLRDGSYGSFSSYRTEQGASEANRVALDAAGIILDDAIRFSSIKVWKTLLSVRAGE